MPDRISIDSAQLYFALALVCRRVGEFIDLGELIQPEDLQTLQEYILMVLEEHEHATHP